jgi:hypothetical protein
MGEGISRLGNYDVHRKIGAGTVGTVYEARQLTMDRMVALKVLNPRYAQDPAFVRRFVDEARTAGSVNHANVCQVYEVGEDKGFHFFSMELVDGPSLEKLLNDQGRLKPDKAMEYMRQAASALGAAYKSGLVHRDVKPANLLVSTATDAVKLVDLGLARDMTKPVQQMELGLAGTPYYMAPEQGQGLEVDIRSDIYALGATFYHMLIGRPPFTGPHATAVLMKHAAEKLAAPSTIDPGIPRNVSAIIERMMAKAPADRYQLPADLIEAIDGVSEGRGSGRAQGVQLVPLSSRESQGSKRRAAATSAGSQSRVICRKQRPAAAVPAAIAGGVLMLILLVILAASGARDPALAEADITLERVSHLMKDDAFGSLEEASELAGSLLGTLPQSDDGLKRERVARAARDEAEGRLLNLVTTEIQQLLNAAADGASPVSDVEVAIAGFERRYASADIPELFKQRADALFAKARRHLVSLNLPPADTAPVVGSETSAFDAVLAEVDGMVQSGRYAQAVELIQALTGAASDGREKERAKRAMDDVLKSAGDAFVKLIRSATAAVDEGRIARAHDILNAARDKFAFEPYQAKIDSAISRLTDRIDAGTPPADVEPRDAAASAIDVGIEQIVALIQKGDRVAAKKLIEWMERKHSGSAEYRRRQEELGILKELVGMP